LYSILLCEQSVRYRRTVAMVPHGETTHEERQTLGSCNKTSAQDEGKAPCIRSLFLTSLNWSKTCLAEGLSRASKL